MLSIGPRHARLERGDLEILLEIDSKVMCGHRAEKVQRPCPLDPCVSLRNASSAHHDTSRRRYSSNTETTLVSDADAPAASVTVTVTVKLHVSPLQLDVKFAVGGWFGAVTVTVLDVVGLWAP